MHVFSQEPSPESSTPESTVVYSNGLGAALATFLAFTLFLWVFFAYPLFARRPFRGKRRVIGVYI